MMMNEGDGDPQHGTSDHSLTTYNPPHSGKFTMQAFIIPSFYQQKILRRAISMQVVLFIGERIIVYLQLNHFHSIYKCTINNTRKLQSDDDEISLN